MLINRLKDSTYIEKWEGYFIYPGEDETYDAPKTVNFLINVEIKNDNFIGTHTDKESAPLFEKDGTIKGYIEDDFISFTLKYPYLYYIDKSGILKTDKSKAHPDIHYYGNFNEKTNTYIGSWDMCQEIEGDIKGIISDRIVDMWEFKIVTSKVK